MPGDANESVAGGTRFRTEPSVKIAVVSNSPGGMGLRLVPRLAVALGRPVLKERDIVELGRKIGSDRGVETNIQSESLAR